VATKKKLFAPLSILYSRTVHEIFPGGVYRNSQTIYEKLESIGVNIPFNDRHYPYYACFDFECYFSQEHLPKNGEKLIFEAYHIPMIVGIASCIPGYEQPVCYVSQGDNAFFHLFPKRHAYLYKKLRSQLIGGLSILFSRLAIAGETPIRSHQIDDPQTCQRVIGLDANSLYLFAIQQENPTGW